MEIITISIITTTILIATAMFVFGKIFPVHVCFNTKFLMPFFMVLQVGCVVICIFLCCIVLMNESTESNNNRQLMELTTKLENVHVEINSINFTSSNNELQKFSEKIDEAIDTLIHTSNVFELLRGEKKKALDNANNFVNNFQIKMPIFQKTCRTRISAQGLKMMTDIVTKVKTKCEQMEQVLNKFKSVMKSNLVKMDHFIESEFDQNIQVLRRHVDNVKKMYEKFIASSKSVEIMIARDESSRISTKYKVLGLLSIFLSFLLLVALIGLLFISNTKTVFVIKSISFLVVLAIFTIAVLSITTIQSSSNNHKTSNSDERIAKIFNFKIPSYSSSKPNLSAYIGFMSCQMSGTFFSPPNDAIFIEQPRTTLHHLFRQSDAIIDELNKPINYDHSDIHQILDNTTPYRLQLESINKTSCFEPQYKGQFEFYFNIIEECKNIDEYFEQLGDYVIEMKEEMRKVLKEKMTNIDDKLNETTHFINEKLQNADFACNPLYLSFSSDTQETKRRNDQSILSYIFIISSLSASIYSIALIARKKENNKEAKKDDKKVAQKEVEPGPIEKWVRLVSKANLEDLISIYVDQLQHYQAPLLTFSVSDSNQNLNRNGYRCIDSTRVILKNSKPDYINASWIHIPNNDTRYILTQSPLKETIIHFWQMCCQENVKCIVMLCDDKEPNFIPYFPKRSGDKLKFGKYTIGCVRAKQHRIKCVTWRIFKIFEGDNKSKYQLINHVSLTGWSKNKIPKSSFDIIELNRWIKRLYPKTSPICVHCDCGYGRSATFVGFDYALSRIDQNIKLCEIVKELRSMRNLAIENREQYGALYIWLLEYFSDEGIVDHLLIDEFMEKLKRDSVISVSIMAKTT